MTLQESIAAATARREASYLDLVDTQASLQGSIAAATARRKARYLDLLKKSEWTDDEALELVSLATELGKSQDVMLDEFRALGFIRECVETIDNERLSGPSPLPVEDFSETDIEQAAIERNAEVAAAHEKYRQAVVRREESKMAYREAMRERQDNSAASAKREIAGLLERHPDLREAIEHTAPPEAVHEAEVREPTIKQRSLAEVMEDHGPAVMRGSLLEVTGIRRPAKAAEASPAVTYASGGKPSQPEATDAQNSVAVDPEAAGTHGPADAQTPAGEVKEVWAHGPNVAGPKDAWGPQGPLSPIPEHPKRGKKH